MPILLLPASAAAFAPRSPPTIVLGKRVDGWLTAALKRLNRKRPLNSVQQHHRALSDALSGEKAIWSLCSLMLPKAPNALLSSDPDPLVRAMESYRLLHVEAYVVHVDLVSQSEVAFKLTKNSIDQLVRYHKTVYSPDLAASTWHWPEKEAQLASLHEDFVQAINKYVYRTGVRALDGIDDDGAGELLDGRSDDVKSALMDLFQPLLPPPPRIVDLVRPATLPSSVSPAPVAVAAMYSPPSTTSSSPIAANCTPQTTTADNWWPVSAVSNNSIVTSAPIEWQLLPAAPPSPTSSLDAPSDHQSLWPMSDPQLPSPAPSCSQLATSNSIQEASSVAVTSAADLAVAATMATAAAAAVPNHYYQTPATTASDIPLALSLSLPLPSMIASQCGTAASGPLYGQPMNTNGLNFNWGYNDFSNFTTTV